MSVGGSTDLETHAGRLACGQAVDVLGGAHPALSAFAGVLMLGVGANLAVHGSLMILAVAGATVAGTGLVILIDGLRRERRRAVLESEMRAAAERGPELLGEIEACRARGENPVDLLVRLGFTDIRVRQYLLGRAAGRVTEPIDRYMRRRR